MSEVVQMPDTLENTMRRCLNGLSAMTVDVALYHGYAHLRNQGLTVETIGRLCQSPQMKDRINSFEPIYQVELRAQAKGERQ